MTDISGHCPKGDGTRPRGGATCPNGGKEGRGGPRRDRGDGDGRGAAGAVCVAGVAGQPAQVTAELRKLLDERGVEWRATVNPVGDVFTHWDSPVLGGMRIHACEDEDGMLSIFNERALTPEQAVEATLGRGTCHIDVRDNLNETDGMGDVWLECDACHWQMPLEPSTPRFSYCPNCGRRVVGG